MADLLGDGNVKVTYCVTLSSITAPTATQLNAGVDLQTVLTKEGLDIAPEQTAVDNTNLSSTSETERAGTTKYTINLTIKRQIALIDDIGYNTLVEGQDGFLAIRRNLAHGTAWAAAQLAEIYPVQCGVQKDQPPKLNEPQTFMSQLFNHTAPETRATVA
jgi:hypothetical protein